MTLIFRYQIFSNGSSNLHHQVATKIKFKEYCWCYLGHHLLKRGDMTHNNIIVDAVVRVANSVLTLRQPNSNDKERKTFI